MFMKRLKKIVLALVLLPLTIGSITLGYLYFIQEKRVFDFQPLAENFTYQFDIPFETFNIQTTDSTVSGVHLKAQNPKGVVYYLHGKGSNLGHSKWKKIMRHIVNNLRQDVVMIDYRGFGKSKGVISLEGLLIDAQAGYDYTKTLYPEDQITVYGLSLGTSFATYVASKNHPKALILEAPFYSIEDVACSTLPFIPPFMIHAVVKYPLRTDLWIQEVNCPIYIFHGTKDEIIPFDSSIRLASLAKTPCDLTIIPDGDHNHLNLTKEYQARIHQILD